MLVLTRVRGQSIQIGEEVTVTVLDVKHNQVRFGIDAPKEISVDRKEIRDLKLNKPRDTQVAVHAGIADSVTTKSVEDFADLAHGGSRRQPLRCHREF